MTPGRAYQSDTLRDVAKDLARLTKPLGVALLDVVGWGGSGFVATTSIRDVVCKVTVDDDECAMWSQIQARGKHDKIIHAGFPAVLRIVQLRGRDIPEKACAILREACDPVVVRRDERVVFSERTERWIAKKPGRMALMQRSEELMLAYRSSAKIVNDRLRAKLAGKSTATATAVITPSGPRTGPARGIEHLHQPGRASEDQEQRLARMREILESALDTPYDGVAAALLELMDDEIVIADTHSGNFGWRIDRDEVVLFDPGWSPVLYYDEVEMVLVPNMRRIR